jgi:hypothetical protein
MIDLLRQARQQVDIVFRANKNRTFTTQELAQHLGLGSPEGLSRLTDALSSVRCPFGSCQSFDTTISEIINSNGFEVHRCFRCDRNFHVQREGNSYSIFGWYGE